MAFSDNFNRADGPLAAPWTVPAGNASILSNTLALSVGGGVTSYAIVDCGFSDGDVQMTATTTGVRPVVRYQDTNNHFWWRAGIGLERKGGAGTATIIASSVTFVAGDILRINMAGSSFAIYKNGLLLGSGIATDWQTSKLHGVATGTAQIGIDDFSANIPAPPAPTLTAVVDAANYAVNLTVTGATGAITVKRYVLGASPTGVLVRGSFANGRVVADRDAPLNTDLVYIATDTVGSSAQVTARIDSSVAVLNVMNNPTLQATPIVLADDNQSYEGASTAHPVLGTNAPLVTVQPPAYRQGTYRFLLPTVDDWLAVRAILMTGAVCLLRSPCQTEYLDTAFILTHATNTLPWSAQAPRHRIFDLDYQAVAPDATPPYDVAWAWADVPGRFATWADVPLNFPTWADVVTYIPPAAALEAAPALGF